VAAAPVAVPKQCEPQSGVTSSVIGPANTTETTVFHETSMNLAAGI
jgi:hypothetical protein